MTWVDVVWIMAAVSLVGFTIVFNLVRKLQGKSGCSCGGTCPLSGGDDKANGGCNGCSGCSQRGTPCNTPKVESVTKGRKAKRFL